MNNANRKKKEQLGMSFGTATARLRKLIMFELVKRCGLDKCYRCGQSIEKIENLSIEHKEAWMDSRNPKELFFDLNNIAFSHLKCNTGASRCPHKIISLPGMAWCWKCKQHKLFEKFPPSKKYKRCIECTKCYSEYRHEYRKRTGKR